MEYTLLLWPHANARYQAETRRLAQAELQLMLARLMPEAGVRIEEAAMPSLSIATPRPLSDEAIRAIRWHSLLYGLFERRPDGSLMPLAGRAEAFLGADLPSVLKYKGKTNELFLHLMINVALYAGNYWREAGRLNMLDPMCGRATAPFIAVNRGWDVTGSDIDRGDLKEAEQYFRHYLEYHRFKHAVSRESRTIQGKKPVPVTRFEFAADPSRYRDGARATLRLLHLDAALLGDALERNAFHIVVCDLPYGIRHDARLAPDGRSSKNWLETLLVQTLQGVRRVLKPGAAAVLSFNAQTFPLEKLRGIMHEAGLQPLTGGPYDQFEHWVEQAITRNIAVCIKE